MRQVGDGADLAAHPVGAASGYPQAECASHAILGANLGPYRSGEGDLRTPLVRALQRGMRCLAERGFDGCGH